METITDEILAENGFYWREKNGVKALICRPLEENGFLNGFSTRIGGVSPFPENSLNLAGFDEDSKENIEENRRRFLQLFKENYLLSTVWQVHGDGVKTVNNLTQAHDSLSKFDALTSKMDNVLLGVKTADCVPILIGDTQTKSFSAVHAGWRGTVQSIAVKTINKMTEVFGSNPENLICAIGPAAFSNYEVGQDVISAFQQNFSNSDYLFQPTKNGHALVNLHQANCDQLENAGVLRKNIFIAPLCTMRFIDLFFSYRVEKKLYGKTGRLLSVIGKNA